MQAINTQGVKKLIGKTALVTPQGYSEFTVSKSDAVQQDKANSPIWGAVLSEKGEPTESLIISRETEINVVYINPHKH